MLKVTREVEPIPLSCKKITQKHYKTILSLVRSTSYGLNITFSKHGFSFGCLKGRIPKDYLQITDLKEI